MQGHTSRKWGSVGLNGLIAHVESVIKLHFLPFNTAVWYLRRNYRKRKIPIFQRIAADQRDQRVIISARVTLTTYLGCRRDLIVTSGKDQGVQYCTILICFLHAELCNEESYLRWKSIIRIHLNILKHLLRIWLVFFFYISCVKLQKDFLSLSFWLESRL